MVKFSKVNRASLEAFLPINLTENDLRQIAKIIKDFHENYRQKDEDDYHTNNSGDFIINIRRGASEEKFNTEDIDFFTSDYMPEVVEKVEIRSDNGYRSDNRITLDLSLDSLSSIPPKLTISETSSNKYITNYYDIVETIKQKRSKITPVVLSVHSGFFTLFCLICIFFSSSLFIFKINALIARYYPVDPKGSYASFYLSIMVLLILFPTLFLSGPVVSYIRRRFPFVQFSGKIRDTYSHSRLSIIWIVVIILIPFLLSFVSIGGKPP